MSQVLEVLVGLLAASAWGVVAFTRWRHRHALDRWEALAEDAGRRRVEEPAFESRWHHHQALAWIVAGSSTAAIPGGLLGGLGGAMASVFIGLALVAFPLWRAWSLAGWGWEAPWRVYLRVSTAGEPARMSGAVILGLGVWFGLALFRAPLGPFVVLAAVWVVARSGREAVAFEAHEAEARDSIAAPFRLAVLSAFPPEAVVDISAGPESWDAEGSPVGEVYARVVLSGEMLARELHARADVLRREMGAEWVVEEDAPGRVIDIVPASQVPDVVYPDEMVPEIVAPDDPWFIGLDDKGERVTYDFAHGAHFLIAGATRFGKSVATYGLLAHLAAMGDRCRLLLADPGDTTVAPWWDHAYWATSDPDPATLTAMLRYLRQEIERRKPMLRAIRADKLVEFTADEPMEVLVIDEAASYFNYGDKTVTDELWAELWPVVSQGAKYGVRIVLILQRPSSSLMKTDLRSQFSGRLCFGVEDLETARMVFPDLKGDELLYLPPGRALYKVPGTPARFVQGAWHQAHWDMADAIDKTGVHHASHVSLDPSQALAPVAEEGDASDDPRANERGSRIIVTPEGEALLRSLDTEDLA